MDNFEKNLLALKHTNHSLYHKLTQIEGNERFEVFAPNRLENANIVDTQTHTPLYEKQPLDDTERSIREMDPYRLYTALYFYGIGNGYLYKLLLENRFLQSLYIFEPELELLYIALHFVDFSKEIASGRLILLHTEDVDYSTMAHTIKGFDLVHFKSYNLHLHSAYYDQFIEDIKQVNQVMTKVFSYHVNATGNDTTDELLGLEHFLQNLPLMIQTPTLRELETKGKITKSAVIVATGPSLAKQLPLLKKIQDYITIISVDASLPILEKEGIKPDIVTSIERIAATGKFYEKTSKAFQEDIIFAITAIADENVLNNIKAGQLQLSMRPTGKHYYYLGLEKWGFLGIGMSAANMAYELASQIGFENIVLIGQDLAYGEDGSSHSKNHIFGENEVKHNDKKDDFIEAYGGEGTVKTTKVWKLFLSGYENVIAKNNKEGKIRTINATEGGARIHGTVELPFEEVAREYIDKEKKTKIKLQKLPEEEIETYLSQSVERLHEAREMGLSMQKSAKRLLKEITQTIKKYQKYDPKDIHRYIKEKESRKLVDKIAKIRNKYYKSEFESFYELLISPLLSHLEYEIAYQSVQPEGSSRARIHKNWKMIVLHHEWCYRVMVNIEAILKIIDEKLPALEECVAEKVETT